jgi:hypothetical protein
LFCCSQKIQKDLKTCSSANKIAQNAYSKFQKIWEVRLQGRLLKIEPFRFEKFKCSKLEDC